MPGMKKQLRPKKQKSMVMPLKPKPKMTMKKGY